jgi:mannose-6-phosphate isomerase-like protein (cupin superfamily)
MTAETMDLQSSGTVICVEVTDSDLASMNSLLRRGVRVGNEDCDQDPHLHELIPKPWGQEYRAYSDDFLDVWHLQIDPGHATSMHVHPRKTTYLLCLAGKGILRTLTGQHEFGSGAVIRISRGAFHTTENPGDEPLMLIEVETPRNKYDLMRLRDSYNRAGASYEQDSARARVAPKRVPYLPNARMCRTSPCGAFAFDILSGMDVHYRRRSAASYLVPLDCSAVVTDSMEILTDGPGDSRKPNLDSYYLGIRRVA